MTFTDEGNVMSFLPGNYNHRPGKPEPKSQSLPNAVATRNPISRIDPSIKLSTRGSQSEIEVTPTVQALLGLSSRKATLGATTEFAPSETYNHNIPPDDRVYLKQSNKDLLQIFAQKVADFDIRANGTALPPYTKLKGDILHALHYFPARRADVERLRFAFHQTERFMIQFKDILAQAKAARPDLAAIMEDIGQLSLQNAQNTALEGHDVYEDLLDAEDLILKADQWTQLPPDQRRLDDPDRFFLTPGSIAGTADDASHQAVQKLANGAIGFPDLTTLLRRAPMGFFHYHRRVDYSPLILHSGLNGARRDEMMVTYPGGLIKSLFYTRDAGTRSETQIPVMTGPDGYSIDGGPVRRYPENIHKSTRENNQYNLDYLIVFARLRLNPGAPLAAVAGQRPARANVERVVP